MFERLPSSDPFDLLQDAIYRWRGIARWPETEATIYSCNWVADQENGGGWYDITFTYWSLNGIERGSFQNFGRETSSPYFRGEIFTLRYNPKHTARFYYPNENSPSRFLAIVLCFAAIGLLLTVVFVSVFH